MRVIFIVSPKYSGSTILTYLLATHRDVGTIGERIKLWRKLVEERDLALRLAPESTTLSSEDHSDYGTMGKRGRFYCSCGKKYIDCPFLNDVSDYVFNHSEHAQLLRHLDYPNFQLHRLPQLNAHGRNVLHRNMLSGSYDRVFAPLRWRFETIGAANRLLFERVAQLSGTSTVVDSSKDRHNFVFLSNVPGLDVYIVRLRRDGRGQVFSALRWTRYNNVAYAARNWLKYENTVEDALKSWRSDRLLEVYYEDLCADTLGTLDKIYQFCGLEPGLGSLQFRDQVLHTIGNARVRFGDDLNIEDKQEWRQGFTREQLQTFDRVAGKHNRAYGYD